VRPTGIHRTHGRRHAGPPLTRTSPGHPPRDSPPPGQASSGERFETPVLYRSRTSRIRPTRSCTTGRSRNSARPPASVALLCVSRTFALPSVLRSRLTDAYVDKGYRGHDYKDAATVHLAGSSHRGLSRTHRKRRRRRSAIEPIIGHMKSDHRLGRCFLKRADSHADAIEKERKALDDEAKEVQTRLKKLG